MSLNHHLFAACAVVLTGLASAQAETTVTRNGTDSFIGGSSVTETLDTPGDTFVGGQTTVARGAAGGDLHIAGFDVSVSADVGQDLYAAGATVVVRGSVGEDLTAAGFTVRSEASSTIKGNARLVGNTVTIDGPIGGALAAAGREVVLNAPIAGDMRVVAKTLHFGPKASVAGILTYSTESEIDVPERVAPSSRVVFRKLQEFDGWDDIDVMKDMPVFPTAATVFFGFIVSLLFFVILGATALGFFPNRVERMRLTIAQKPGLSVLLGAVGLSILFGMVFVSAMTIVGIPLVPIVILAAIVAWTLGYVLGAYAVAMRIWSGLGGEPEPGVLPRLIVLATAITAIALLNFIPFVGWVVNFTLVLLGIGAMTHAIFQFLMGNPVETLSVDMTPKEN